MKFWRLQQHITKFSDSLNLSKVEKVSVLAVFLDISRYKRIRREKKEANRSKFSADVCIKGYNVHVYPHEDKVTDQFSSA